MTVETKLSFNLFKFCFFVLLKLRSPWSTAKDPAKCTANAAVVHRPEPSF